MADCISWEKLSEVEKEKWKQAFLHKLQYKDESVLIQTIIQWLEDKSIGEITDHFKTMYEDNLFHEYIDSVIEDTVLRLYEDEINEKGGYPPIQNNEDRVCAVCNKANCTEYARRDQILDL